MLGEFSLWWWDRDEIHVSINFGFLIVIVMLILDRFGRWTQALAQSPWHISFCPHSKDKKVYKILFLFLVIFFESYPSTRQLWIYSISTCLVGCKNFWKKDDKNYYLSRLDSWWDFLYFIYTFLPFRKIKNLIYGLWQIMQQFVSYSFGIYDLWRR